MTEQSSVSLLDRLVNWILYQFKMLPHRPRLWWRRAWIRKDEFDPSLNMDSRVLVAMNEKDRKKYISDLVRRRNIAHERDLGR